VTASAPVETCVAPAYLTHPPYERTLGDEVADLGELVGFPPDPEQRLGLDLIFAQQAGGVSAALEFAVICARQNLKTGLFKLAALGWMFLTDQRLVVWSAHEFSTAQEAFRDLTELVEGSAYLSRRVKTISRSNGEEAIELHGDRRLRFRARTKTGGRGLSGDKIVLDEAFALQPSHMGALLPTLSARPDPQVLYGSSAGLLDSAVLRGVRDRGRRGGARRLTYVEWCDDLGGACAEKLCDHDEARRGCRLDDRRRWGRANPAMGRRITEDYIEAERGALTPAEFGRERLGWWDDPGTADRWQVISESEWGSRRVPPVRPEVPAFAVAASWPDADRYSIAVAGRAGDRLAGQVLPAEEGSGWVIPRLQQLIETHKPCAVVMRDRGPTAALHAEAEKAGLDLVTPWTKESATAFRVFNDAVSKGEPLPLAHFDQDELNAAVAAAARKPAGDGWVWDQPAPELEAVTLAAWGHVTRAHLTGQQFFAAWR
jgi:hypothetical protein